MSGLFLWAQSAGSGGPGGPSTPVGPSTAETLSSLAIRKWFGSVTLTPGTVTPNFDSVLFVAAGLMLLFLLASVRQGFGNAFLQLLDLPGHLRLFRVSFVRLQKSSRVLAVAIGATVLVWTTGQMLSYSEPRGTEDLKALLKTRGLSELATEQGALSGLIPWRDVFSFGDYIPVSILASAIIFQAAAMAAASPYILARSEKPILSYWATVAWGGSSLYALYRLAGLIGGSRDLPLSGCFVPIEAPIVPVLMLIADGLILAWLLVEMRNASLGDVGNELVDTDGMVQLLPAAIFACFLSMPGRYISTAAFLLFQFVQTYFSASTVTKAILWQVRQGAFFEQAIAYAFVGLAGAAAWTRGKPKSAVVAYFRLLRVEGGRLVAVLAAASVFTGLATGLCYFLVLSMPTQTWVLAAADSYAHYATVLVGLMTLATMVELGERSLPLANLANESELQADTGV